MRRLRFDAALTRRYSSPAPSHLWVRTRLLVPVFLVASGFRLERGTL